MKFSTSAVIFSLLAGSLALIIDNEGVQNSPRDLFDVVPMATVSQTSADGANPAKEKRAGDAPQQFKDNNGRTIVNGGCCNNGVNLRQDICQIGGQGGRCIPAAKTREGCVGLTCVADTVLSCDPNVKDRGRDKCVLDPAKDKGGSGAQAKAGEGAAAGQAAASGQAAKAGDAKQKGQ
ncbi:hypothetical protein MCOR25_000646 [Pyricularia grisea]|nr:hypothetical protein MCOR25_000646 [Pyricularia grisea]